MSIVKANLEKINSTIPEGVSLVAVSKTKPADLIQEAYDQGHRIFGENRAQELAEKASILPEDIEWHMIGHLQSNKVKYIAEVVDMVHSIDSLRLLEEVNRRAEQHHRKIKCLLQFHIAEESTKYGLDLNEARELLSSESFQSFKNIRIVGVMGMATFTDDLAQVRREFHQLKSIFDELKSSHFSQDHQFSEISMGMSGDYQIAIEEGSTMVRVGSSIFGSRY